MAVDGSGSIYVSENGGHRIRKIVLTGSEDDWPRADAFQVGCNGLGDSIVNAAGDYRFPELVDLLAGASCTVSVNTGVMHLAAATGAPTIGLNGPTAEHRWGPIGAPGGLGACLACPIALRACQRPFRAG